MRKLLLVLVYLVNTAGLHAGGLAEVSNIYWAEIAEKLNDPQSSLHKMQSIQNAFTLGFLFGLDWVHHFGVKAPGILGRKDLTDASAALLASGPYTVLTRDDAPSLHAFIDDLAHKVGIAKPLLVYSSGRSVNAAVYSLNASRGILVLFRGLLEKGSQSAVEGFIAHEMGHIKHKHIAKRFGVKVGGIAASALIGLIILLAAQKAGGVMRPYSGLLGVGGFHLGLHGVAPLLNNWYSRYSEKEADEVAAQYVRHKAVAAMQLFGAEEDARVKDDTMVAFDVLDSPRYSDRSQAHRESLKNILKNQGAALQHSLSNEALMSTHPATINRVAAMKKVIADGDESAGAVL